MVRRDMIVILGCPTEFDHGKVASPPCVKQNSMVHHDKWEWTAPNGSDKIGEHGDRRGGNRPHFLVNLGHRDALGVRSCQHVRQDEGEENA